MQQQYQCPQCGAPIAFGVRFCGNCGTQLNWPTQQQVQPPPPQYNQYPYQQQQQRESSQQSVPVPNTSGQGKQAIIPYEIQGWNWGAFLLTWMWGIGNNVWISFLTWIPVPLLGLIMSIVLGAEGSKWAWQSRRWDSVEHFNNTQRTWRNWGIGLVVVLFIIPVFILGAYFIYDTFLLQPTVPYSPATQ